MGTFGSIATFDAGCFGYVSDITSREERTKSMSIAASMITISLMGGMYYGAFITNAFEDVETGYYVIFGSSLAIGVLGSLYAVFMEESMKCNPEKKTRFFSLSNVKDSIRVVFIKKENRMEKLIAIFIFLSATQASWTIDYEYMMGRLKYQDFDRSLFSIYSGTKQGQDIPGVGKPSRLPYLVQTVLTSRPAAHQLLGRLDEGVNGPKFDASGRTGTAKNKQTET